MVDGPCIFYIAPIICNSTSLRRRIISSRIGIDNPGKKIEKEREEKKRWTIIEEKSFIVRIHIHSFRRSRDSTRDTIITTRGVKLVWEKLFRDFSSRLEPFLPPVFSDY